MTAGGKKGEVHSPRTSPPCTRSSTPSSLLAVQNDLYASGSFPVFSLDCTTETTSIRSIINIGMLVKTTTASTLAQKYNNRMSAPQTGGIKQQVSSNSTSNNNTDIFKNISTKNIHEHQQNSNHNKSHKNTNSNDMSNAENYSQLSLADVEGAHKSIISTCAVLTKGEKEYPGALNTNGNGMKASIIATNFQNSTYFIAPPTNTHNTNVNIIDVRNIKSSISSYNNGNIGITSIMENNGTTGRSAPPLPSRQSSTGMCDCVGLLQNSSCVMNKMYGCTVTFATPSTLITTSISPNENHDNNIIVHGDGINKNSKAISQKHTIDLLTHDIHQLEFIKEKIIPVRSILDEEIEVGPAETIMGIIDTRSLEARQIQPTNITIGSKTVPITKAPHISPNFKTVEINLIDSLDSKSTHLPCGDALQQQLDYTHLCSGISASKIPNVLSTNCLSSSSTIINTTKDSFRQELQIKQHKHFQHELYENITIFHKKYCSKNSFQYENIDLEYISLLMSEGYSKENAISALGISRNNIEMACDILHQFVSKKSNI